MDGLQEQILDTIVKRLMSGHLRVQVAVDVDLQGRVYSFHLDFDILLLIRVKEIQETSHLGPVMRLEIQHLTESTLVGSGSLSEVESHEICMRSGDQIREVIEIAGGLMVEASALWLDAKGLGSDEDREIPVAKSQAAIVPAADPPLRSSAPAISQRPPVTPRAAQKTSTAQQTFSDVRSVSMVEDDDIPF